MYWYAHLHQRLWVETFNTLFWLMQYVLQEDISMDVCGKLDNRRQKKRQSWSVLFLISKLTHGRGYLKSLWQGTLWCRQLCWSYPHAPCSQNHVQPGDSWQCTLNNHTSRIAHSLLPCCPRERKNTRRCKEYSTLLISAYIKYHAFNLRLSTITSFLLLLSELAVTFSNIFLIQGLKTIAVALLIKE